MWYCDKIFNLKCITENFPNPPAMADPYLVLDLRRLLLLFFDFLDFFDFLWWWWEEELQEMRWFEKSESVQTSAESVDFCE